MEMFISRQPKAIGSRMYQMIAMTIFYNHVLRYINKLKLVSNHCYNNVL